MSDEKTEPIRATDLGSYLRGMATRLTAQDQRFVLLAADILCDVHPHVEVYPRCSACEAPYVLRYSWTFGGGGIRGRWLWQRDCAKPKSAPCKGAAPVVGGDVDDDPDD